MTAFQLPIETTPNGDVGLDTGFNTKDSVARVNEPSLLNFDSFTTNVIQMDAGKFLKFISSLKSNPLDVREQRRTESLADISRFLVQILESQAAHTMTQNDMALKLQGAKDFVVDIEKRIKVARLARDVDVLLSQKLFVQYVLVQWSKLDFVSIRSSFASCSASKFLVNKVLTELPKKLYECLKTPQPSILLAAWLEQVYQQCLAHACSSDTRPLQHRLGVFLVNWNNLVTLLLSNLQGHDQSIVDKCFQMSLFCQEYMGYHVQTYFQIEASKANR